MTACSFNPLAARLVGINVRKLVLLSFGLSAAVGAVAGAIITPITLMEYDRGPLLALKGFAAAVLGGLGSGVGAIAAGFIIGILESLGAGLISSGYKDAIALLVLLVILWVKPSGLLGNFKGLQWTKKIFTPFYSFSLSSLFSLGSSAATSILSASLYF
jgi:branched-chain amino acid transport system permease protein